MNEIDIDLIISDQTLPRTKDYICQNKKCKTHNSSNYFEKEAVFYRPNPDKYITKYACCVCKESWYV